MPHRVIVPSVVFPPGAPSRPPVADLLAAAKDRAYRRATDSLWPLRDPRGAVPMKGAYAMPESELVANGRAAYEQDTRRGVDIQ
jgi:hypothetical protein